MNPLTALDDLMADYLDAKQRRAVHSLIILGGLLWGIWEASDHNWQQALIALAVAIYGQANKANTPATALDPAGTDSTPDDDQSYEDIGGNPFPEDDEPASADNSGQDIAVEPVVVENQSTVPQVSGNPVVPTEPPTEATSEPLPDPMKHGS